jgi:hypothetical protein
MDIKRGGFLQHIKPLVAGEWRQPLTTRKIKPVTIFKGVGDFDFIIDAWLTGCRVIGLQVEQATLNIVASQAQRLGARRVIGKYIATNRIEIVALVRSALAFFPIEVRMPWSVNGSLQRAVTGIWIIRIWI